MLELIKAFADPNIIIPIMVFSIPIVAIVSSFYFKLQKLKLTQGKGQEMDAKEIRFLKNALAENADLRERVENLEAIITSLDKELLQVKALNDAEATKKYVAELADQMQNKQ